MTSALANPTIAKGTGGSRDGRAAPGHTVRMDRSGQAAPRGRGLRDEAPPRLSLVGVAAGLGALWGLLGYSILWDGVPITVDRPFVQSVGGTLVLLPVRAVLWGIHLAEDVAGRPFDLSRTHWWIALAAGAVGAAILFVVATTARGLARGRRGRSEASR